MAETTKPMILIVDDEPEILHSLQGLLRMEFDVQMATSGPEALAILEQKPIQVILSDQRMPEMSGVELLGQARGECPRAVRVLFTAYSDVKAVIDAINQGQIFRYLAKPWEPDELLGVLRQACAEYDRRTQRQRLFDDLQSYQMRCLTLIEGLLNGEFGMLNDAGHDEVNEVAKIGYDLLHRFDRSLGIVTEEGAGG